MALDSVNNRMFIPAFGNGGYRGFLLKEDGTARNRSATTIIGRESIYGRRSNPEPDEYGNEAFPGTTGLIDNSTQRLFSMDRFNNRIVVYDINPETLKPNPRAIHIIGQPDFKSTVRGLGPNRMMLAASAAIDEDNQRFFVADPPNNRVLVFDIHPDRLDNDPHAYAVIGQADFTSREPGVGPGKFTGPGSVAYDPQYQRLFVADNGNNRVLIFGAGPDRPEALKQAVAVMGQKDFTSREPRKALDELKPEGLAYDWRYHRLFISEDLNHRVMVYDAHPDRISYPTKAIAVVGQPDATTIDPVVSQSRLAMPRISIDPGKQKLYVSEGFPAGNRISIWDIAPENLKTGMPAVDVYGHETPEGEPDFNNRMAQGHLDGKSLAAARSVALDPVDHRLFIGDEYNHRVVVYQLDSLNRFVEHEARWVLGQPDLETSLFGPPAAENMSVPLDVEYDSVDKRLYVGDGYHNRVLVYDAAPDKLKSGMAAAYVIGQNDFNSNRRAAGKAGIDFEVRMGRGIASSFIPMGFAIDEAGRRLFLADGKNNRILIYDIRAAHLKNGVEAVGVIGQDDFDTTAPQPGAKGLHDPGHLAFDPLHQRLFAIDGQRKRVLVFDVEPKRFRNGAEAIAVLGKPDFTTDQGARPGGPFGMGPPAPINGESFITPNGIDYDPVKKHLYIADGGGTVAADRVLVFDAAPEKLKNGASAIAALGAESAEAPRARYFGGETNYPGQFTIRDTRGIALDHQYGRLFTTGSFESRLVAFHFPRAAWPYDLGAGSTQIFGTLDAVDLGGRADPETVTAAVITSAGRATLPYAMPLYSVTRPFMDERTQRHSRMLISEATLPAREASRQAMFYIEADTQRRHRVHLYNPSSRRTDITLTLRRTAAEAVQAKTYPLAPGEQLNLVLEDQGMFLAGEMTATIVSRQPVHVNAFRETTNSRGELLLTPAPIVFDIEGDDSRVVPGFINGGNQRSQLVLLNPTDTTLRGTVSFHDTSGARANPGTVSDFMTYHIPAHGVEVIRSDGAGPVSISTYAVISPDSSSTPEVTVLTRSRYGEVWMNESAISATHTREALYAIDLRPTPVRHGIMDVQLLIVNSGRTTATVQLAGIAGKSPLTQRIATGEQLSLGVKDLFGADARGLLTLSSDQSIVVTALQQTLNLRAELIVAGLAPMMPATAIPYVPNGGGLSTEIRLGNAGAAIPIAGQMLFRQPDGTPSGSTILR